jgi:acetyl-CoA synthetase
MDNNFVLSKTQAEIDTSNLVEAMLKQKISWPDMVNQVVLKNGGTLNICKEALDIHLNTEVEKKIALRFIGKSWPKNQNDVRDISYGDLLDQTMELTSAFVHLGLTKGDVLFSLSPPSPESYLIALASLRAGIVYSPLFSVFGPGPILARMEKGKAKVLFTSASLYHKKIAPIRHSLTTLTYLIILDDDGSAKDIPNHIDYSELLNNSGEWSTELSTTKDDLALLHFTSNTSGTPRGAMHVHAAIIYQQLSGKWALDFKKDDVFWCTADHGQITGITYGILSPLSNGVTIVIDEAEFNARRWYEILEKFKVTNWYSTPWAMKMLMRAGEELPFEFDFSSLRFAAIVGGPLHSDIFWWVKKNLDIVLHDNWSQVETGGIIISNLKGMAILPGAMGKALPGIEVSLVTISDNREIKEIKEPNVEGQIAIKVGWPSMFSGYIGEEESYSKYFIDDWYLSGVLAKKDLRGYFWFKSEQ